MGGEREREKRDSAQRKKKKTSDTENRTFTLQKHSTACIWLVGNIEQELLDSSFFFPRNIMVVAQKAKMRRQKKKKNTRVMPNFQ